MAAGSTKDSIVKATETPPDDDLCPICFGDFTLACMTAVTGFAVWNLGSAFQPCKCPMCCRHIKNLTPEASVYCPNEEDAKTILKTVRKYNHLFVGGTRGFILCKYNAYLEDDNPDGSPICFGKLPTIGRFCRLHFCHKKPF